MGESGLAPLLADVGLVIALTSVARPFVSQPRFLPVVTIALGVSWNLLMALLPIDWSTLIRAGVLVSLAASGLYGYGQAAAKGATGSGLAILRSSASSSRPVRPPTES